MFEGLLNVENYKQMKKKISVWIFFILLLEIIVMDKRGFKIFDSIIPNFSLAVDVEFLKNVDVKLIVYPFLSAIFSFIFTIHDKLSDFFKIRSGFEFKYIFSPITINILGKLPSSNRNIFLSDRHEIMRKMFYRYASSTEDGIVQRHHIHEALTNWSWVWIALEVIFFNVVLAIISMTTIGRIDLSLTLIFCASFAFVGWFCWRRAKALANAQIKQIMDSVDARAEIVAALSAEII